MTNQVILTTLKKYGELTSDHSVRQKYLQAFRKKMLYRSTKTENPETTIGMVEKVLHKLSKRT